MRILDTSKKFFSVVGGYFPFILPILVYLFLDNVNLAVLLFLDFALINPLLKRIVNRLGFQTKRPLCDSLTGYECFGMPSGHTEIHWILLTYLILKWFREGFNNNGELYLLVLISLMTIIVMWQRLYTGKHTIAQILGGISTGIIIGSLFYFYDK